MGSMVAGVAGREFRQAVETATGHAVPGSASRVPDSVRGLPQPQRVRRLARELNALFNEWDHGRIPLDLFREELRALGVDETMEAQRLIRGTGTCTFAQLFRALCTEDDSAALASAAGMRSTSRPATAGVALAFGSDPASTVVAPRGASGGAMGTSAGGGSTSVDVFGRGPLPDRSSGKRMVGTRVPMHGRDVVTWRGDFAPSMGSAVAWNTARMGNIDSHGHTTGREDKDYMAETGAGALLRGRGDDLATGATWDAIDSGRSSVARAAAGTVRQGLRSAGVAGALFDDVADISAKSRFESTASSTARRGLGGDSAAAGPVTSAGYGSSTGALVRQQLYSLVRQLDSGAIAIPEFRDRLSRLGVGVPLSAEKLLADFAANGKADFGRFVRSFDDEIARLPVVVAAAAAASSESGSHGAGSRPSSAAASVAAAAAASAAAHHGRRRAVGGQAVRGHGDIVSWHDAHVTPEEEAESLRMDGLRPRMSRDRHIYDDRAPPRDIVAWTRDGAAPPGRPDSRRAPGPSHIASRTAGDFIGWAAEPQGPKGSRAAAAVDPYAGHAMTGDPAYSGHSGSSMARAHTVLDDGSLVGGGVARVDTELARKAASTLPPYGTETDVLPPSPGPPPTARGGRFLSPTMKQSVDWSSHR